MTYSAPTSLEDALNQIARMDVQIVAGCTDFFPSKPQGPLAKRLLDVSRLSDLRGISQQSHSQSGGEIRIGAATTWSEIARADLPAACAGLQAAAREVGSLQIQNVGTIGGNICNASPAADGVPPLLTLEAQVEVRSARATRLLPLSDFITGVRKVDLRPDEMVTAVILPPPGHAVGAFTKLGARRYLVISITMTAALIALDGEGQISKARISVGACSPVAKRLGALEAQIIGQRPDHIEITPEHLSGLAPIDDVRGSGAYRLEAVAEQCHRAVRMAADKFKGLANG